AFLLYALTKGSSTHQALASMLDHMERLRQEPVTDDELQFAKDAFLNSFVFSFANAGLIVGRLMALEYYGLPKDFLQRFRDSVVKLTKEDLLRVARKHLHPDRVIILAVGKADDFEKPLSTGPSCALTPSRPRPASGSVPCCCSTWSRADPAPPICSAFASGMRPSSRVRPGPSTCGTIPRATSCLWRPPQGSPLFARCSTLCPSVGSPARSHSTGAFAASGTSTTRTSWRPWPAPIRTSPSSPRCPVPRTAGPVNADA